LIVTKTPLRVSLFGGGTDFPEYYRSAPNGGAVIGFALNKFVYVTVRRLPAFFKHKHRAVWSEIELVRSAAELHNPIYRAALSEYWDEEIDGGIEAHYDSDLPAWSGLGSSSAFAAGLLLALASLRYGLIEIINQDALAQRAIELERIRLGEPGGHQDQVFAAYGGFNRIDFNCNGWSIRSLGDPIKLLRHCLLFYTGQQRQARQLEGLKAERLERNRDDLDDLRRSVDIAQEMLITNDFASLGELLHATWQLKQRLAPGVSYPELNEIYDRACTAGAWGGKLLGAGGGGFLLLLAARKKHANIRCALSSMLEVPVGWSPRSATVYSLNDD
jgi:D-glycero-alpha-D-manno-heptose-7-phosphate kinase